MGELRIDPPSGPIQVGSQLTVTVSLSGADATWLYYVIWTESGNVIAQNDVSVEPGKSYEFKHTFTMPSENVYALADAGNGERLHAEAKYTPSAPPPSPSPGPSPSPSPSPGAGVVKLVEASHPDRAVAGQELSWYVVGEVQGGAVENPAVGYAYVSGPAPEIYVVLNDGRREPLRPHEVQLCVEGGTHDPGFRVDSRSLFRGAVLPYPGTYTIDLVSGKYTGPAFIADDSRRFTVTVEGGPSPSPSPPSPPPPPPPAPPALPWILVLSASAAAGLVLGTVFARLARRA